MESLTYDELAKRLDEANVRLFALSEFKNYVHDRLDKAGVPHNPDPEHNAQHGCRIAGRLKWCFDRMAPATPGEDRP